MANQTLNDILTYIEAKGATIPLLVGNIKVSKSKEPYPGVCKDYGLQVYLGLDKPQETIRKKIGPIALYEWQINCDLILNRSLKSRDLYSDPYGVSYWVDKLTATFINGSNNGNFKTSWWEFLRQEEDAEAVVLKGIFHCEVEQTY